MTEQIEDIIRVSSKGQIVIPREIRKKMGVKGGEKLLVLTCDGDIVLRKTRDLSLDEIAERIEKVTKEGCIDVTFGFQYLRKILKDEFLRAKEDLTVYVSKDIALEETRVLQYPRASEVLRQEQAYIKGCFANYCR